MNDEQLQRMLRAADVEAGDPSLPDLDAGRLTKVLAQRHRRRIAARATIVVVALACGAWWAADAWQGQGRRAPAVADRDDSPRGPARVASDRQVDAELAPADVARLQAELAELRRQAEYHESIVRRMNLERQLDRQRAELRQLAGRMDADWEMQREIERTAVILLTSADWLAESDGPSAAAAEYRNVAEQFPNTRWAELAQIRINDLNDLERGEM
jgi:TolA-binding protein